MSTNNTKTLFRLILVASWLSAFFLCTAQGPSFTHAKEAKKLDNQYIVQFVNREAFQNSKISTLDDNNVEVVSYIKSRYIGVYKFSSKRDAEKWHNGSKGVKYFEEGKYHFIFISGTHFTFKINW